ncbi:MULTISPECIES: hypothetical protein [Bacillota]|uniref:hypothetical protein n=1 Tax=Bacillota TaxID=1239 RepID=UPI003F94534B
MTQQEAINRIGEFIKEKPTLSFIPKDTPVDKLYVRHGGYDISELVKIVIKIKVVSLISDYMMKLNSS